MPDAKGAAAQALLSRIQEAREAIAGHSLAIASLTEESSLSEKTEGQQGRFYNLLFSSIVQDNENYSLLREASIVAREKLRGSSRLYRVNEGDTLEIIAARELGSSLRANEIGIRPDELAPGVIISLPTT